MDRKSISRGAATTDSISARLVLCWPGNGILGASRRRTSGAGAQRDWHENVATKRAGAAPGAGSAQMTMGSRMKAPARLGRANGWSLPVLVAAATFGGCLPRVEVAGDEAKADAGDDLSEPPADAPPPYGDPPITGATPDDTPQGETPNDRDVPDAGVPPENEVDVPSNEPVAEPGLRLTLVVVQPLQLEVEVPIQRPLRLTFSAALDAASVSGLSFELVRSNASPVTGTLAVDDRGVIFTPAEPLVLGNSYVMRYQGSVRSTAGVEWNGSGEVSFQTRVGRWALPENLSTSGDTPRVAFAGAGSALAIWNQIGATASGAAAIGVSRFTAAQGWEALPSPASCGPACRIQLVAGGSDGTFESVWSAEGSVQAQPYHPERGFGEIERISARSTNTGADAAVANGELWLAANVSQGIVVSRMADGVAWLPQTNAFISDLRETNAGPLIVADAPERARVFWLEDSELLASTFSDGSWSAPQFAPNFRGPFAAIGLSGAGVPSGDVVLAWEEDRPSEGDPSVIDSELSVLRMAPNGAIREEGTPSLPDGVGGNATSPAAAMNPGGEALLAWLQTPGNPDDPAALAQLFGAFHSATETTWSTALPLSVEADGAARPPAVGLDPSGNGHVLWVGADAAGEGRVLTARFSRESGLFGATVPISAAVAPSSGLTRGPRNGNDNCQLAVDAQGRALAIWATPLGEIWAARFE
jgi:hypothetical protein